MYSADLTPFSPKFRPPDDSAYYNPAEQDELRRIARDPKTPPAERNRINRRLRGLAKRGSKRAHGADKAKKAEMVCFPVRDPEQIPVTQPSWSWQRAAKVAAGVVLAVGGTAIIVVTVGETIATFGVGAWNDPVTIGAGVTVIREGAALIAP